MEKTNKKKNEAPHLTVVEFKVEQGFAASGGVSNYNNNPLEGWFAAPRAAAAAACPTTVTKKTKTNMKQTMKLFAMAALALAVVATTACSKDDEQAESTGKVVVSTATVSLADGTKALTSQGEKTFSDGDEVAVVYENTSDELVKTTVTLAEADISNGGKTASLTVSMTDPKIDGTVKHHLSRRHGHGCRRGELRRPGQPGWEAETIASSLDLALFEGSLNGEELPASPRLDNPLAVCEFQIKNATGSSDLTSSITMLYIADGTNSYYLSGLSGLSSIWVAMKPVASSATLTFHAAAGNTRYVKEISGKTLAANNMYHVAVGTTQLKQGALFGTFSVSGSSKVRFSQGNLKYDNGTGASTLNQYDYLGGTSHDVSESGSTDLFGWVGASSNFTDVDQYGVTTSVQTNEVNGYGNVADEPLKADWGTLAISNGGNTENSGWRTLTGSSDAEWQYLFDTRTASTVGATANARYAKAYLFGTTHGVILFPDNYTHPTDVAAPTGINTTGNTSWDANTYTAEDWAKMEAAGAVFLPAAGMRFDSSVYDVGTIGYYWSSSPDPSYVLYAYDVDFNSGDVLPANRSTRSFGFSVRLACPVE